MIVLSGDEVVKELLDKRSALYSDRQEHYLAQEILSGGNRMGIMTYGPRWRMLRKMVHNLLNVSKSESYIPYQDLESKQLLFELLTRPQRFLDSLRRYAMSVTSTMVSGFRTVSFDDPRLIELFEVLDTFTKIGQGAAAAVLDIFPVFRWLPDVLLPPRKAARESHKKELSLFGSLWLSTKSASNTKPCFCVDMAKVQKEEGFSDDLAAYTSGSLLEAGADTTSNTLYGFIQAMILFPEVQRRAQQCIDKVVGSERPPDEDDYDQMPYIRNCVKEITRWMPAAILGIPHAVIEDDEYKGYRIPKGAGILLNVYSLHMDPKRHPEPREFIPERWEDNEGGLVNFATNSDVTKRGTFVFGAGRRVCQGMHVAERSLYLAISRILWAFDILPAKDDGGNDIIPDSSKLTQGFVCMPEPYDATFRPRSPEKAALIRKIWADAQSDLDPDSKQWR